MTLNFSMTSHGQITLDKPTGVSLADHAVPSGSLAGRQSRIAQIMSSEASVSLYCLPARAATLLAISYVHPPLTRGSSTPGFP